MSKPPGKFAYELVIESYKDNMRKIKDFDPQYDLSQSGMDYIKEWHDKKEEFVVKRIEIINLILAVRIRIIEDTLLLNKMIEEFMDMDKDCEFSKSASEWFRENISPTKPIPLIDMKEK